MRDNMPSELKRKLPHDIRLYMRNFWQHPNDSRDYDFYDDIGPKDEDDPDDEEGEFLYYLADDDSPLNPKKWGDINVLLFCRGGLKTTIATAAMEWAVSEYPFVEADVTAPRQEQFGEVMDRFKSHIKQSGLVQLRTKDNVSHQKFERKIEADDGSTSHAEADVKARSAWGDGDALRGLHGHLGVIDEFQDVDEGMFSTFLEAIDQSVPQVDYFPTIFVIGTPKMANSFFNELWKMSDQKDWTPEEGENGSWVSESEPNEFIPTELKERREELHEEADELIEYLHGEAREAYNFAKDRENPPESLYVPDEVDSIAEEIESLRSTANGIEGYKVRGWHIDQYASPIHNNAKIEFKKQKYTKKKFKNEVMAEFYTPENDLLNDTHVTNALDRNAGFKRTRQRDDSTVTVGVDWGGGSGDGASDTVIVVGETYDLEGNNYTGILDIDFIDSDLTKQQEIEAVEDTIRDYQADRIAVDEGYGAKQREDLQDGNNIWNTDGWENVCGIIYGNIKDKERPKFSNNNFKDSSFCTVARTHMIENMVGYFKDGRVTIPADDLGGGRDGDMTALRNQLTAPYTDRVETSDGKKKLKVLSDRNDDAFQAFVYMWIAAHRFGSTRTLKSIHTSNRRGI